MFPPVYKTLHANADLVSIVGTKIGRHGRIPQDTPVPYITWFIVIGQPYDTLSEMPQSDFTSVQIDCWARPTDGGDAQSEDMANAVRAALDVAGVLNRVIIDGTDPETKLYRVGIQADFITQR